MSDRMFPIMSVAYDHRTKIAELRTAGVPFAVVAIPWDLIAPHEAQAQRNHSQTLEHLAERGGLSPAEAVAVIEGWNLFDRDARSRLKDDAEAHRRLAELVIAYQRIGTD